MCQWFINECSSISPMRPWNSMAMRRIWQYQHHQYRYAISTAAQCLVGATAINHQWLVSTRCCNRSPIIAPVCHHRSHHIHDQAIALLQRQLQRHSIGYVAHLSAVRVMLVCYSHADLYWMLLCVSWGSHHGGAIVGVLFRSVTAVIVQWRLLWYY